MKSNKKIAFPTINNMLTPHSGHCEKYADVCCFDAIIFIGGEYRVDP